jgi:hypothetical protein
MSDEFRVLYEMYKTENARLRGAIDDALGAVNELQTKFEEGLSRAETAHKKLMKDHAKLAARAALAAAEVKELRDKHLESLSADERFTFFDQLMTKIADDTTRVLKETK